MVFHFLLVLSLISLVHGENNGYASPEMYWKSMLPNTLMPTPLQQLLNNKGMKFNRYFNANMKMVGPSKAKYAVSYWAVFSSLANNHIFNNTTIFFLIDNLNPGEKMTLVFTKSNNGSNFLPRKLAEAIPFSIHKFQKILKYTSIKSASQEARLMKQTVEECEAPGIKGEEKYCATSLESMVDFVVDKLGNNEVQSLCNEVGKENEKQEYVVEYGIKKIGENAIVCHKQPYAYAVYYCHRISHTLVYMVPMVAADGFMAKALVVCHLDTSTWDPRHFAFRLLNVKPGGPPICHFLDNDSIVWLSN